MDAINLIVKGSIIFIISITILVILSIPLSVYRIVDLTQVIATVLLLVGIFIFGSHFYANRPK